MFKILRILVLLLILASVWGTYRTQQTIVKDWSGVITIKVIPVYADNSLNTRSFVKSLRPKDFEEVRRYLNETAKLYTRDLSNVINLELEAPIASVPPSLPRADSGRIAYISWSLRLRWWAWKNQLDDHENYHVRLFMLYQSPAANVKLAHSTGLRKGLIGLINARAFRSNKRFHNVVLTHELLHIFGATDKYDTATGEPFYPQGYVTPNAKPLWPQKYAEIMGRAKALSQTEYEVAERLSHTRVAELTAKEIGWLH
jgi:hypothetical protein